MTETFIKSGLIQPSELHELMRADARVRLVDASYVLPGNPSPFESFKQARIDDAVFFDIEVISDHKSSLPHMLPGAENFAKAVSGLGISNDDFVVVYGQAGIHMGPARAWWMFRVFGHDRVCVLDGGLSAWIAARLPVNTVPPTAPVPGRFKATLCKGLLCSMADMQKASESASAQIYDARPEGRFAGRVAEPRPGLHSGHIPGSYNIPATALLDSATGKLKPASYLEEFFKKADLGGEKPIYTTCGSGITACTLALALYRIGFANVAVYDGSWSEWGQPSSGRPVNKSP
jgi:thiosulfate/3-mercaptopyruvate sulfurtransferase